jgi:hypothetical protein
MAVDASSLKSIANRRSRFGEPPTDVNPQIAPQALATETTAEMQVPEEGRGQNTGFEAFTSQAATAASSVIKRPRGAARSPMTTRLTNDLLDRLLTMSRTTFVSQQEIVEKALDDFLRRNGF